MTDPNAAQRRAADPTRVVWVSASAGSGKTKTLVDRILALLLGGAAPEKILCVTYTRAAAAEMAARLNALLGRWTTLADNALTAEIAARVGHAADAAALRRARRLFAQVVDAPGGLQLRTVHGFCESLLGRFPLEAGLTPGFTVLDDRLQEDLLAQARDVALRRAAIDPALKAALATAAPLIEGARFDDLLRSLLNERRRLAPLCADPRSLKATAAAMRRLLGVSADADGRGALEAACADDAFDAALLRRAAAAMIDAGDKTMLARGETLGAWLAAQAPERQRLWDTYIGAFLTQKGEPLKNPATKKAYAHMAEIGDVLTAEAARLMAIEATRRGIAAAEAAAAATRLAGATLAAYEEAKHQRNALDYDDLILRVQTLLSGGASASAWVLFKLDGGLDHILLDEAQDTSPEQWDILTLLCGEFFTGAGARREQPRTLFVVGDVKQSIYSFQRADPESFHRMRAQIRSQVVALNPEGWDDVPLDVSFRSTAAVLTAVDATFASAAAREGVTEPDASPIRHAVFRSGQSGRVELWPLSMPEAARDDDPWTPPPEAATQADATQRLAERIAAQAAAWIGREPLPSRGRTVRAGDILILVQTRATLTALLARALKAHGVGVAGIDRMALNDQMAVKDLLALARFLLLPDDDLTLAALLKSPFVGLTDDDLLALAWGRGRASLWRRLRALEALDPRFATARAWLSGWLAQADFLSPFDLFGAVLSAPCPALDRIGTQRPTGREALIGRLGLEAEDPLEETLSLILRYEQEEAPSLQGFLRWFENGGAEVKRDMEAARSDQARIMTVHGAKGLQAPVVFLADAAAGPSSGARRSPETRWVADGPRLLPLWMTDDARKTRLGDAAQAAARHAEAQEYRRLLYVAMTRAEDRLIVCGALKKRSKDDAPPDDCWWRLVQIGLTSLPETRTNADPAHPEAALLVLEHPQTAPPDRVAADAPEAAAIAPLPEWARQHPPLEPTMLETLTPSGGAARAADNDNDEATHPTDTDGAARRARGVLAHRLLQQLPERPLATWAATAARLAAGSGVLDSEAVIAATLATLTDPRLAPLFGPGGRAEVAVTGTLRDTDGRTWTTNGRIDRVAVTADAVLVADYKVTTLAATDRAPPDAWTRQMAAYAALLRPLYPDKTTRAWLVLIDLDDGRRVRICEVAAARLLMFESVATTEEDGENAR